MKIEKSVSWGLYPKFKFYVREFDSSNYKSNFIKNSIVYGNGRSYGDSCVNKNLIDLKSFNHFLNFDQTNGVLTLQSGALLKDIIEICIPKGWFLITNPGTKLITVGGAIASDIHGKNHHKEGCFSECVNWFNLLLPNGEVKKCSFNQNKELFLATCGGMGLTGIILEVELTLKQVKSKYISQTTVKTDNLKETFSVFESIKNESYSVAWIDCLSKNNKIGRSIIMYGDFIDDENLNYSPKRRFNIPFNFPSFVLNKYTVKLFNWFYYNKVVKKTTSKIIDFDSFFFPLDSIRNWNRIYGKNGFTQYQFILPKKESYIGIKSILKEISKSGNGSFLAVLKLYGKENENYLSFPMEGYSLALDFKIKDGIENFLNSLDKIVLKHKGRIYLAKDVRVSKNVFEKGYPKIDKFRHIRKKYKLEAILSSRQSKRVEI
tara:strand:+ start:2009 stop:3307 length:1299 start_codon:yes stop_codon:yes gene_type:complete